MNCTTSEGINKIIDIIWTVVFTFAKKVTFKTLPLIYSLNPEIRIFNQPEILTSEADIKSDIFSDKFLVVNLLKDDGYFNVRYQIKPFMLWIWASIVLLSIGGMLSLIRRV